MFILILNILITTVTSYNLTTDKFVFGSKISDHATMSSVINDNSIGNTTTTTYFTTSQPSEEDNLSLLIAYISIGISGLTLILIIILIFIICCRRKKKNFRGYKPQLTGSYVLKTRRHYDSEYNTEITDPDYSIGSFSSNQVLSTKQTNDLRSNEEKPEMREKEKDVDYANQDMVANNRHTIYNDRDLEILNNDLYIPSNFH